MKIVMATGNKGKIREVRQILEGSDVISMKEAGLSLSIVEDGTSFLENAAIKAQAVYRALKEGRGNLPLSEVDLIVSDDSGLEIDFFDKKPGIYSARWLGEDTPYDIKNGIVLEKMQGVPDEKRTARYVCAIVCLRTDGSVIRVEETAEGIIAHEPSGEGGFGYDPIFLIPGRGTFADLTAEEKNLISHRGKALRAMKQALMKGKE